MRPRPEGSAVAPRSGLDGLMSGAAHAAGDRAALGASGHVLSYRELDEAVDRLARRLTAAAAEPGAVAPLAGARVAVVAPNVPALVLGLFAVWRAGAVAVPLSARLREYELQAMLEDAQAEAALAVAAHGSYSFVDLLGDLLPRLSALRACLFLDDAGEVQGEALNAPRTGRPDRLGPEIAAILYTSGTTGAPKGALVTHARELRSARSTADVLALTPQDRTALPVPASHAFGLACLLAAIESRGFTVLVDSGLSAAPLLAAMAQHHITVLHGSSDRIRGAAQDRRGAGAACARASWPALPSPPELIGAARPTGARILNLFGMTELGAASCCRADDPPGARLRDGRPAAARASSFALFP